MMWRKFAINGAAVPAPSINMRNGLALDRRIAVCARYTHATIASAHE